MRIIYRVAWVCLFVSIGASGGSWDSFGDHKEMKDYVVTEVGNAEKLDPPSNTGWSKDVYQLNQHCFTLLGHLDYWGYGGKAAFILANQYGSTKIALFERSVSSVKVEVQNITMIKCPSSNVVPYSDEVGELMKSYERQQEGIKLQVEELIRQDELRKKIRRQIEDHLNE